MKGKEVSCRVPAAMLPALRVRRIAMEPLLEGLSVTMSDLKDSSAWFPWEEHIELLERVTGVVGGLSALADLIADQFELSRAMKLVAGALVSPRRMVLFAPERIVRSVYTVPLGSRCEELPDGRIYYRQEIPPPYRGSLALWYASMGCFRAYPRATGQDYASVEAEIEPSTAQFWITLPPSRTLPARALDALRSTAAGLQQLLPPVAFEDLDEAMFLIGEAKVPEQAAELGQRLMRQRTLPELARELREILRQVFMSEHMALMVRTREGSAREVFRTPAPPRALRALPLLHGEVEIGRLELDLPRKDGGEPPPLLLPILLPWIASAVVACRGRTDPGPAEQREERLARAAATWQLTPRQRQVLVLLLGGCCNKEIAKALGTSVKTAEVHVSQLLRRAGVDSRTALIARFYQGAGQSAA